MITTTGLKDLGPRELSWCTTPAPATPRARLRGVTWAGNLLAGCFVLGFGTWSAFAPLESAAIASGAVESESSRKTIQHLEGGIIREILVADGDVVRTGQILIALDDTKARAEAQSLQGQLWDATAREVRLQAEQQGQQRLSFPQDENPQLAAEGWGPRLWDYFYVSLTNATAFSPTDAMPLTRPAKVLMAAESTLSAVTVLLIAARAVNILL